MRDVLWMMRKEGRIAEARVRMIPGVRPELRIYATGHATIEPARDLFWSKVIRDGAVVNDEARRKAEEFAAKGWAADPSWHSN